MDLYREFSFHWILFCDSDDMVIWKNLGKAYIDKEFIWLIEN